LGFTRVRSLAQLAELRRLHTIQLRGVLTISRADLAILAALLGLDRASQPWLECLAEDGRIVADDFLSTIDQRRD
jgi:hypothetical protein